MRGLERYLKRFEGGLEESKGLKGDLREHERRSSGPHFPPPLRTDSASLLSTQLGLTMQRWSTYNKNRLQPSYNTRRRNAKTEREAFAVRTLTLLFFNV